GQRSPKTGKVFVPSAGYDPLARALMSEDDDVELPPTRTVVGFTVITPVQYYGQKETEPYIRASVLLDGADTPLGQQDIRDIPVAEFRVGMRVRAQFRPPGERNVDELTNRWAGTGSCIERWVPTGEADVMALVNRVLAESALERREIDFTIAGSCDYLSGMPFAFISNVDAFGAWPPVYESHVEMDGAWALFEGFVRMQMGDIDTCLVAGSGKSSPGRPRE